MKNGIDLGIVYTVGMALMLGFLLMPLAEILGKRFKFVVRPRLFRKSSRKVSYLGGVALSISAVATYMIFWPVPKPLALLLLGAFAVLVLGLIDDKLHRGGGLKPSLRFLAEVMIAAGIWALGLQPTIVGHPITDAVLTIAFLVGAANAVNLTDNMDGVAGCSALVMSIGLCSLGVLSGQLHLAGLGAALFGCLVAFLRFNIRKARLYLGDSGSLFLGFLLGGALLLIEAPLQPPGGFVLGIAVMGVVFMDVAFRQISRWMSGSSLFDVTGGVDHMSHRLVALGLSPLSAALVHGAAAILGSASAIWAIQVQQSEPAVLGIAIYAIAGLGLSVAGATVHRRVRRGLAFAAVFILGGILTAAPSAIAASREMLEARRLLIAGSTNTSNLDQALDSLRKAEDHAARAERELSSPSTAVIRRLPGFGGNLAAAGDIATAVRLFADSSQHAATALKDLSGTPPISGGTVDLVRVKQAAPALRRAEAGVGVAIASISSERRLILSPLQNIRSDLEKSLVEVQDGLNKAAITSEILPSLLGDTGQRRWFVAIQNSAEMRGTGGFIGGFGILTTEGGKAQLVRMEPDRNLPKIKAPVDGPLEVAQRYDRFEARSSWLNVNMTPDFPTAARMMSRMWEQTTGEKIDGVIGIDAVGMSHLLKLVGPVDVPEMATVATAENVVELTLKDAYSVISDRNRRQDVLVNVGREAFGRLAAADVDDPRRLADTLGAALRQKHMLVWTEDHSGPLADLGVDGGIRAPEGSDYLMVVGQNAAANKLDYYSSRKVDYDVDLTTPGLLTGKLKVDATNGAPASGLPDYVLGPEGIEGPHRSYLSVYLPGTSDGGLAKLNGADTSVESHRESGLSVLSHYLEMRSGETASFDLSVVGKRPENGEYRLVARRQPGINPDSLSIRVRLPEGATVSDATDGVVVKNGVATWAGVLEEDLELVIRYEPEDQGVLEALRGMVAAFR